MQKGTFIYSSWTGLKGPQAGFVGLLLSFVFLGCRQHVEKPSGAAEAPAAVALTLEHAKGFSAYTRPEGYTVIQIHEPWPGASREYRYALVPRDQQLPEALEEAEFDAIIQVPVRSLVLTSTTHIPALEALSADTVLLGFPGLAYVSSPRTRKRIDAGLIEELGANDQINTERVIALQPEVVIGFGVTEAPRSYSGIVKAGIPVLYNGDWTEASPLGKAEWIKFFGLLLGKETEAVAYFDRVASDYSEARELAAGVKHRPKILSGALYRDVWYTPGGRSWAASFIEDAGATYLWGDTETTGSLSLSLESVLEKAEEADVWIAPSQFRSFTEMREANTHYEKIRAFQEQRIYTYANTIGATGGMLYFEQAPGRPDLVLKDLIYHIHPGLLQGYEPTFFQPLKP